MHYISSFFSNYIGDHIKEIPPKKGYLGEKNNHSAKYDLKQNAQFYYN